MVSISINRAGLVGRVGLAESSLVEFRSFEQEVDPSFPLEAEFVETVRDMARGTPPRTVTHALLERRETGTSLSQLVALTGSSVLDVEASLAKLIEFGWALSFSENGFEKYVINGHTLFAEERP